MWWRDRERSDLLNEAFNPARFVGNDHEDEVARARNGDAEIWSLWYERYHRLLYRYALIRLGEPVEAEDLVSQTFVTAIEKIDSFKYRGKRVLAWLYTIARNLIIDRRRREQKRGQIAHDFQT